MSLAMGGSLATARRRKKVNRKRRARLRAAVRKRAKKPARKPTPKPAAKPVPKPTPKPPTSATPPANQPPTTQPPTTQPPAPGFPAQVPTAAELHLLNRLGCGFSQVDFNALRSAGGAASWLEGQLHPETVPEAPIVADIDRWYADLRRTPAQKVATENNGSKPGWHYGRDLGTWTMLRRAHSRRPVLETMVDFWTNHLHIADDGMTYPYRFDYDRVIRKHALGRFENLLLETATHPAMSVYLDNWRSRKNAPNENQGRELLELHTVTPAAGYTEEMVKASAALLSGYSVKWGGSYEPFYDTANHTTGPCTVLGFSHPNGAADGRPAAEAYLRYLARHPSTARTVARRMAIRFVSDQPSPGLVDTLAEVFTNSGTDIRATLKALVGHPEFLASAGAKVTTPIDGWVRTTKALGVRPRAPRLPENDTSYAHAIAWAHGSMPLYSWPRPDGAPEGNSAWSTPGRVLQSCRLHLDSAGGWWPKLDVDYVAPPTRLPKPSLRFEEFVDHLCRTLLGTPLTPRLLSAVCQRVELAPTDIIDAAHRAVGWTFPHIVGVLLDTPVHLTR